MLEVFEGFEHCEPIEVVVPSINEMNDLVAKQRAFAMKECAWYVEEHH